MEHKYVRILKSGFNNGYEYRVGQMWEVVEHRGNSLKCNRDSMSVILCIDINNKLYGVECEFIDEKEPVIFNNYEIY